MNTAPDTPPTDQTATRLPFVRSALLFATLVLGGALVGFLHEMLALGIWHVVDAGQWRARYAMEYHMWRWINVAMGALLGTVSGYYMMTGLQHVSVRTGLRWCLFPVLLVSLPVALFTRRPELAGLAAAYVFLVTVSLLDSYGRRGGRDPIPFGWTALVRRCLRALVWMVGVVIVSFWVANAVVGYREALQRGDVHRVKRDLGEILSMAGLEVGEVAKWDKDRLEAVLSDLDTEASGSVLLVTRPEAGEMLLFRKPTKLWERNAEAALEARGDAGLLEFVYDPTNGTFSPGVVGLYYREK